MRELLMLSATQHRIYAEMVFFTNAVKSLWFVFMSSKYAGLGLISILEEMEGMKVVSLLT